MKVKNETKLLFLLLAGTGLALGLLTSPFSQFSDPSAVTEPNQPAAEPVSALSPGRRAKAQMLSNLEHQVAWYMSKHDDHQPGVVSSKRSLLFQLPSAGSNTPPTIGDPNRTGNLFQAADPPAPKRVILKLKQAPSSQISAQPQSRSLASHAQPVPSDVEGPVPSDVEGPVPSDVEGP
ncbi:MAG: hypothetical protein ACO20W_10080, partial [Anaerohalosphaeraceae bacterium]